MKIHILFLFFLSYFLMPQAQELDWYVLNDCSGSIIPKFLEVDSMGNSYVVGIFSGETLFNSRTKDGPKYHSYSSIASQRIFFLKYDPEGKLLFSAKIYSKSSNGIYSDSYAFIQLHDGGFAFALHVNRSIYIKDADGADHMTSGREQVILLLFNANGTFKSGMPLGLTSVYKMLENEKGEIIFHGNDQRKSPQIAGVFSLQLEKNEWKKLQAPAENIVDFALVNGRISVLTSKFRLGIIMPGKQSFSLYELQDSNATQPYLHLFSQTIEGQIRGLVRLLEQSGKVEIVLKLWKNENANFLIGDSTTNLIKKQGLLVFDSDGKLKNLIDFEDLSLEIRHFINQQNGGYIGTGYIQQDDINDDPQMQNNFERFILIFDSNLKLQKKYSISKGFKLSWGCQPVKKNGKIYLCNSLINFENILGTRIEQTWREGFYVARLSQFKE